MCCTKFLRPYFGVFLQKCARKIMKKLQQKMSGTFYVDTVYIYCQRKPDVTGSISCQCHNRTGMFVEKVQTAGT